MAGYGSPLIAGLGCLLVGCSPASPRGPATPGVAGDTITIAALTPLSDAVAVIGNPLLAGLEVYFQSINQEKGGVAGRYRVRILAEDITYANPSTSVQKYQKIKDQVALIAIAVGTDHVNSLLPLLEEDSIVTSPTTFDAEWIREPRLLPFGVPYQIWVINGASYYREKEGADKTICSLVLATGYGEAGEEGLEFAAKELGFPIAVKARFRQDDQDFVAPITQLRNARCDAVFLGSLPGVTGKVLGAAAQLSYEPRWIAQAPSWHGILAESPLEEYYAKTLWVLANGPEWGDTTVAGMRAMVGAVGRYRPQQRPDLYFTAGWVIARGAHHLLEKAVALGDLSRAGLLSALQQLGTLSHDGLWPDYGYGAIDTREPPRTTSVFRINPAKPFGLEELAREVSSPAAERFQFARKR